MEISLQTRETVPKWRVSLAYVMAMGCLGTVLVAIGSTFEDLADQVHETTTDLSTVFIIRGIGSIFGTASCSKMFYLFPGNYVLSMSMAIIMIALVVIPFSTSTIQLHICFFLLGLGCSVTDTGCQLMTRKLYEKDAGPWLGINATVFGLSAAFVPILELVSRQLLTRYVIFSSLVAISFCYMYQIASRSGNDDSYTSLNARGYSTIPSVIREIPEQMSAPHHRTEILVACMLFSFVGGGVTCTAYLESYVDQTGAIDRTQKEHLFLVLWLSITIGRFLGVYVQRFLGNDGVIFFLSVFSSGGFFGMLLVFLYPSSSTALWLGTITYGLFHGPTVGFCQDLNNRLTIIDANSMVIVMFGLVCGASVVPFLTGLIWDRSHMPITFIIIVGFSMLVPLPLAHLAQHVSYLKSCAISYPDKEIDDERILL
jgi:Major Facilitator Superfamily